MTLHYLALIPFSTWIFAEYLARVNDFPSLTPRIMSGFIISLPFLLFIYGLQGILL